MAAKGRKPAPGAPLGLRHSADFIECGVEDLTPVRVLQDRLSQAHRMEAVGRLAAEVAVTCGNLLRGVQQNAEQWLMTDGSDRLPGSTVKCCSKKCRVRPGC